MNQRILALVIMALTALLAPLTSQASGKPDTVSSLKGPTVVAQFEHRDGCLLKLAFVDATSNTLPSAPTTGAYRSSFMLLVAKYDTCEQRMVFYTGAGIALADNEFGINGNIKQPGARVSATLKKSLTMTYWDVVNEQPVEIAASVDLAFTSTGDPELYNNHVHWSEMPGINLNIREHGHIRTAQASGSIIVDGESYALSATPNAQIADLISGEVVAGNLPN